MTTSGFPYGQYFGDVNVLSDIQVLRRDRTWLLGAPRSLERHDVVLWLGCNILRTTHLARTVVDVLGLLEVDFVAVAGMAYCCGSLQHRNGDLGASRALADASVQRMTAFQPKTLVVWCPSCFYFYDEILARRHLFPFRLVHATEFLANHLEHLRPLMRAHPFSRVALHAHTGTPQRDKNAHFARMLLEAVPGLSVVGLAQESELGRHCTDEVAGRVGTGQYKGLLDGVVRTAINLNASTLTTIYHSCQRELCGYEAASSLQVENFITLLGRSLGVEYPDKYKQYTISKDQQVILGDAAPYIQGNGLDPKRAKETIQRTFCA